LLYKNTLFDINRQINMYKDFRERWRDVINLHPDTAQKYNTTTANGEGHGGC